MGAPPLDEIFKKQDPPVVVQVEGTEEKIKEILEEEEPKPTPKPKKKRVASQKQREALARTRAKRAEIIKKRQEEKNEIEKQAEKIQREKKIVEAQQFLQRENPSMLNAQFDMEKAVLDGIQKYETLRKQRKEEKRIQREKEAIEKKRQEQLKNTVSNAVNGGYRPQNDHYAGCFNFSY